MFKGPMVALVTPFKDNKVDYDKLEELINRQIDNGTMAIVPCGTTGESATLSHQEHRDVIKFTVDAVNKRVPVIAGTGSNNTAEAIELTAFAEKVGANGALVITPYYNKPTQAGLVAHFSAVAENTEIPIVLYNVPSRTGTNMLPSTVAKLTKYENIVAIKEASGSMTQALDIIQLTHDKIKVISGDDGLFFPLLTIGAVGVISVVSNVVPQDMRALYDSFIEGDYENAKQWHYKLNPLIRAMFYETNPIPVKATLNLMGLINKELRLPLVPMSSENLDKLKQVLADYSNS